MQFEGLTLLAGLKYYPLNTGIRVEILPNENFIFSIWMHLYPNEYILLATCSCQCICSFQLICRTS